MTDPLAASLRHFAGHGRVDRQLAGQRLTDREAKLGFVGGLENVADRAGVHRRQQQVGVFDHAQYQDTPRQSVAHQRASGLEAVHVRHAQVHQNQVGVEPPGQLDGFLAVARFADDVDVRFLAQQQAQTGAGEPVVVGDQDASAHPSDGRPVSRVSSRRPLRAPTPKPGGRRPPHAAGARA